MTKAGNEFEKIINAYKKVGETPLEAIVRVREEFQIPEETPMTYAGRLDPMAEGVILLLAGKSVHEKEDYLKLEKEYEFQMLFGFSTDTYDLLGRVDDTQDVLLKTPLFEKTLQEFVGKIEQAYPPYSSKPVDGQPLFMWAREGRLHEIDIPTHEVEIKKLEVLEIETISVVNLKDYISKNISKVTGDFRQKETIELWNSYIDNSMNTNFEIAKCRIVCSSGTYVRTLVHDIGEKLHIPTTTFSIKRTRVGDFG